MANLILTGRCSKGCSFCFASDFRASESREMSLAEAVHVGDQVAESTPDGIAPEVSLLGGEPTSHRDFSRILDHFLAAGFRVHLISNLMYGRRLRRQIDDAARNNPLFRVMVNANDLDQHPAGPAVVENYNSLLAAIRESGGAPSRLVCGLTLSDSLSTPDGFDRYFDFLMEALDALPLVRLSLNFPGSEASKDKPYFLGNLALGDLFHHACRRVLAAGGKPMLDCIVFPCMFRSPSLLDFVTTHAIATADPHRCLAPATDYLPDGTVRYCFPVMTVTTPAGEHRSESGVQAALRAQYEATLSSSVLPGPCLECEYRWENVCDGPCLGFLPAHQPVVH